MCYHSIVVIMNSRENIEKQIREVEAEIDNLISEMYKSYGHFLSAKEADVDTKGHEMLERYNSLIARKRSILASLDY